MNRASTFAGAAVLFGDAAVFHMLFFTFARLQTEILMQMGFASWVVCLLLLYAGNLLFLRRPRAVPAVAGLNVAGFGIMTALVLLTSSQIGGFLPFAFAVLFLMITTGRAASFALHPISVSHLLSSFSAHLIAIFFFALAQEAGELPVGYNLILLAALLGEIVALTMLRVFGDGRNILCSSRLQGGVLMAGALGALGALLLLFFALLSEGARSAASQVVLWAGAALKTAVGALLRLLSWLISLIPYREMEEYGPDPGAAAGGELPTEGLEQIVLNPTVLIIVGSIAAAVVLGLLVYALYRLRRVKLTAHSARVKLGVTARSGLGAGMKRRLAERLERLRFWLRSWYYRNTPPGVLIALERWARRHKMPRRAGETHGAFLLRLGESAPYSEGELPALLRRLKRELDLRYYAGTAARGEAALSARELRSIRAAGKKRA